MPAIVSDVVKGSIAEELGIAKGDIILSIDEMPMADMIDYNFMCKSDFLTLEIQKCPRKSRDALVERDFGVAYETVQPRVGTRECGKQVAENCFTSGTDEVEVIELEKDYDEDLGIIFESAVFDRIKPCLNKCIFCFVDQQPKGLRDTLYIKDDDYRLSYLQGTYITLTNFNDKDKERVARMHLGPFYVSVHTTNPELRVKMLRNPNAGKIMDNLNWFRKNKIPFHAQIVLCPGWNDGAELERTLKDLATLKNTVLSVAIVPVGVTQFRAEKLVQVDAKVAKETIEIASKYKKVCCSDEFFLLAGMEIPDKKYYGDFGQLDDGVGSIRYLLENFKAYKLPKKVSKPLKMAFATSYAAKDAFYEIAAELNKIENLAVTINPVKSNYWGENITVAGLITSDDLIATVKDLDADYVVIPGIMLKPYSEDFLDGNNLDYVRAKTNKKFIINYQKYTLDEVIDLLTSISS